MGDDLEGLRWRLEELIADGEGAEASRLLADHLDAFADTLSGHNAGVYMAVARQVRAGGEDLHDADVERFLAGLNADDDL